MNIILHKLISNSGRALIALLFPFAMALATSQASAQSLGDITLNVNKETTCGCCNGWVDHVNERGFASIINHPENIAAVKEELGVLLKWQSCHTAVSDDGFLFEGHVPAKYITQFLAAPPSDALGLAAPGMPMGSPGMDFGDAFTPYDIILMMKDGSSKVFAKIASKAEQYQ